MSNPFDTLFPYQRRWVEDGSRLKMGLWSRQSGKSTACAAEVVADCLQRPGTTWVLASAGQRQALELMEKVRQWSDSFAEAYAEHHGDDADRYTPTTKRTEVRWPNGSRALALPANAKTVRGYSANVVLDEFAFYENAEELWRALYPTISNPLGGGVKKLRIVTTPNGPGNRAHRLWTGSREQDGFSRHLVTIHDAVRAGLPMDLEDLRRGLCDPEAWAQEYECQFQDSRRTLLPYELISSCEAADASLAWDWAEPRTQRGERRLYLGMDFARRQDLSVLWTLEELGGRLHTREVLVMAGMSSPDQAELIRTRLRCARRLALDATGPGTGLADWLVAEFGELDRGGKVEACRFSQPFKRELFGALRLAFERQMVGIPQDRAIREDLHLWTRKTTTAGEVAFNAQHTTQEDGLRTHGDRAVALALALRAAGGVTHSLERPRAPTWQPVRSLRERAIL